MSATRRAFPIGAIVVAGMLSNPSAFTADALSPASERFAADDVAETPSFQRHVVPLLGRLGCNGRACHGSFQGQGGFRLSLFGYDFEGDHAALTSGDEPRVDLKQTDKSLLLQKPTLAVDHQGGERFKPGTWQEHLLRRWIESGAAPVADDDPQFVSLTVAPAEIDFARVGDSRQLQAVVEWSDGSREDVTPLCRFTTNDESIAAVDERGLITCRGAGDTHVVVFYDNGVTPVPVLLPFSPAHGKRYPPTRAPTKIDEFVVAKLRRLGVTPSDLCTDAEFLRRVSLDLTGTLPSPDEVRGFLVDDATDKRSRKIDELLQRPTYAAWWTTRFNDWLGNNEANGQVGGEQGLRRRVSELWFDWVYRRLRDNMPYDELTAGIVLAVGRRPEQTYDEYCAETSAYYRNGSTTDFADHPTLPFYWSRRSLGQPDGKALAFAYSFLGVRLECAQCHKHPFDQWTKQDFDQFAAFFNGVRLSTGNRDETKARKAAVGLGGLDEDSGEYKRKFVELLARGEVLPFKEIVVPAPPKNLKTRKPAVSAKFGRVITPRLLGGEEVLTYEYDDPRQPLLDWLRQDDNPYFAKAVVNRIWANYFHIGLIDPPDDMNLANPPSNAPLLDWLTREFVAHGYDLKWLHREITASATYQRSWRPNETNVRDERNFSHAIVRRIPAEAAYDALATATANDALRTALTHDETKVRGRAIGAPSGYAGTRDEGLYAANLFGRPPRAVNCDCERSSEPTLLQTVYLQNDAEVFGLLDRKDGWLTQVFGTRTKKGFQPPPDDELVEEAYLRTLSRLPSDEERRIATEQIRSDDDRRAEVRTLFWALLNTKEFILNH